MQLEGAVRRSQCSTAQSSTPLPSRGACCSRLGRTRRAMEIQRRDRDCVPAGGRGSSADCGAGAMEHMPELTWCRRERRSRAFGPRTGADGRAWPTHTRGCDGACAWFMRVSCGRKSPTSAKQLMALRAPKPTDGRGLRARGRATGTHPSTEPERKAVRRPERVVSNASTRQKMPRICTLRVCFLVR